MFEIAAKKGNNTRKLARSVSVPWYRVLNIFPLSVLLGHSIISLSLSWLEMSTGPKSPNLQDGNGSRLDIVQSRTIAILYVW